MTPDGSRRPSVDTDVPPVPSLSHKTFRRKKQAPPAPKPEIDLTAALPPSDEFRTSLLMPNLSARFSMLREQDDPKSKIGKANDDSVLFPKRASRLDLFGRQGLGDIAEVDSIHGAIRPPFAQARTESYGSGGYDTDEGSVMSRSRPGEGNTMFGGRQKIYKIPVGGSGSVKNFNAEEGDLPSGGNMGGKALYESDIAMSAFQKLREEEKRQERERLDAHAASSREDRSGSPPLAKYNRNRETSSSTNSGPSQRRISTAATSVASQKSVYGAHEAINGAAHALPTTQPNSAGSDRPTGKTRRLYGQGLDQHLHEQQSSALQRLESINRSRTPTGGPLSRNLPLSRSASNLSDRFGRGTPPYASSGFRAGSPPPAATPPRMQEFDLGLPSDDNGKDGHVDSGYGKSPSLSPPMSPSPDLASPDATLVAALEPNDLGKATASGAFNKPSKQYDEQQYLQRQLALQEGRGTPSPSLVRPFSPQAFSFHDQSANRSRNGSLGSNFSRANSVRQPWEHHMEDRVRRAVPETSNLGRKQDDHMENPNDQSFLNGFSGSELGSESEADPNSPVPSSQSQFQNFSQPRPPFKPVERQKDSTINHDQNLLQSPSDDANSDSRSYRSEKTITQPKSHPAVEDHQRSTMDADSPTLGPVGVPNGLSTLVHQHLRNDSGASSVYPDDSVDINNLSAEVRDSIFGHASALSHSRQQSRETNGTNDERWAKDGHLSDQSSVKAPAPLSFAARHILEQAQAIKRNQENPKAQQMLGNNKAQRLLGDEAPMAPKPSYSGDDTIPWQEQLRAHHARVGSNETQQEREDLANELAERRRMVQENLMNHVQADQRTSPGNNARTHSPGKPGQPFGTLKKNSRGQLVDKQEHPPKAMKMLGMGADRGLVSDKRPDVIEPIPGMFVDRVQLTDRAMPPKQRYPPQPLTRPQDVRQLSDTPSYTTQRGAGSLKSQGIPAQKASPPSSQSGSSYSDRSDRRSPESRKGSVVKANMGGMARVNGYSPNGVVPAFETAQHRKGSVPADGSMADVPHHNASSIGRSQSAMASHRRTGSNGRSAPKGHPQARIPPPNTPFMKNPATKSRPNPNPYSYTAPAAATSSETRPSFSSASNTAMLPPQGRSPTRQFFARPSNPRKGSINKHDISEPIFITSTSSVDTVNLPENASLRNGMDSPPRDSPTPTNNNAAPPIPTRDARRKRTHTLLQAFGRADKSVSTPVSPTKDPYEERSAFSGDDDPAPSTAASARAAMRQRLRKTSSEGGSMAQKARQQALNAPGPAVPALEVEEAGRGGEHLPYRGKADGMF